MNPLLLWDCEKPDPSKPLDVDQWEELRRQKRDAAVEELDLTKGNCFDTVGERQ